ncbi:hypothetical protein [Lysinibacillus sp. FSL K6-3209]|uniref:hypothetical protein n=1 Tax=Lysinibacillus sp. FSL K6-3209 TaxID=2921497 RepID=UPI0030DB3662
MDISEILSNKGVITSVPTIIIFSIPIIKKAIDSFNIKAVEKILYSPSKRLGIFLTQVLLIDILILFIYLSSMFFLGFDLDKTTIGLLIYLVLLISIPSFSILFFIIGSLSVKFKFSFKDDNGIEWDIEKRINKKKVLACKKNTYKFFEYEFLMDIELERKLLKKVELPLHKKIYDNIKKIFIITASAMIVIGIGAMVSEGIWRIIFSILFIIVIAFLLYVETIRNNKLLMDQYEEVRS